MDLERQDIHFGGHVQGIGFRYTTQRLAAGFAVTGWVKNLTNGQVHLVVEGKRSEIKAFLKAIQAEMGPNIDDTQIVLSEYVGQFTGFEIVR